MRRPDELDEEQNQAFAIRDRVDHFQNMEDVSILVSRIQRWSNKSTIKSLNTGGFWISILA
jgi:hypothetical protein